jgi:predicted Zn finger-like uncharacterized protein
MPMDVRCPDCEATFPVTEAAAASKVQCPYCEHEFTTTLDRSSGATPLPPNRLAGKANANPAAKTSGKTAKPAPRKPRHDEDEDDEELSERDRLRERRANATGAWAMLAFAGVGLVVVLGGLGAAIYLLSGRDKTDDRNAAASTGSGNNAAAVTNANPPPRMDPPRTTPPRPDTDPSTPTPVPGTPSPSPPPPKPNPPAPKPAPPAPLVVTLTPVPGTPFDITPPTLAAGPVTVELPGRVETALAAGGGRFLVLHLPAERKLALFDVNEGRITREAALEGEDARVATGMNAVAVVYPTRRGIHRYSLPDLTRQATGTLPTGGPPIVAAAMGSATNGPLLLVSSSPGVAQYDLQSMRLIDNTGGTGLPLPIQSGTVARAAANGTLFTIATPTSRLGPATVLTVRNGKWTWAQVRTALPLPGPGGDLVFGYGEMHTSEGRQTGPKVARAGQGAWLVPAAEGTAFLKVAQTRPTAGVKPKATQVVTVHADQDPQNAVATVGELPELEGLVDWRPGVPQPLDRHLFYVPRAKLLAVIPASRDKLVLRRVEGK